MSAMKPNTPLVDPYSVVSIVSSETRGGCQVPLISVLPNA